MFSGEGCGVDALGTQGTQNLRTSAVLAGSDILEVVGGPVEDVAVDMVYLHLVELSLPVEIGGPWTDPREGDEFVAVHIVEMAHKGINVSPPTIVASSAWRTTSRTEIILDFVEYPSVVGKDSIADGEESPVARAVEGFDDWTSPHDSTVDES